MKNEKEALFTIQSATDFYLSRKPLGESWVGVLTSDAVYDGAEVV
jgi:hypothetical protein